MGRQPGRHSRQGSTHFGREGPVDRQGDRLEDQMHTLFRRSSRVEGLWQLDAGSTCSEQMITGAWWRDMTEQQILLYGVNLSAKAQMVFAALVLWEKATKDWLLLLALQYQPRPLLRPSYWKWCVPSLRWSADPRERTYLLLQKVDHDCCQPGTSWERVRAMRRSFGDSFLFTLLGNIIDERTFYSNKKTYKTTYHL